MDILKDKAAVSKDYISRYSGFPYYYNTLDKKYIQGLSAQLDTETSYVIVSINANTTLDFLANKYYGRPDYWWAIADFNRIQDPFIALYPRYTELKIPSIAGISFKAGA